MEIEETPETEDALRVKHPANLMPLVDLDKKVHQFSTVYSLLYLIL